MTSSLYLLLEDIPQPLVETVALAVYSTTLPLMSAGGVMGKKLMPGTLSFREVL
ncbi:hypothetical protein D3C73_764590 [compost metagenome]